MFKFVFLLLPVIYMIAFYLGNTEVTTMDVAVILATILYLNNEGKKDE